jgi:hypothetical protein
LFLVYTLRGGHQTLLHRLHGHLVWGRDCYIHSKDEETGSKVLSIFPQQIRGKDGV